MISALLFAAAAASFTPPHFTAANADQLQQDYRGDGSAVVMIDVKVDPKGRVIDCKTVTMAGSKEVAASVCGRVKQLRVKPASIGGDPAFGVERTLVQFSNDPVGDKITAQMIPADMELQVNKLPTGTTLRVPLNVLVDAGGQPQACYADKYEGKDAPQAYADVACTQVSGVTFGSLNDNGGKPVRYVRSVIVDFELAASQKPGPGG